MGYERLSRFLAGALLAAPGTCSGARATIAPMQKWVWDGNVRSPGYPHTRMTPIVAQLTDDDGDGDIDVQDTPDVVIIHTVEIGVGNHEAILTVVDGATGAEHFSVADPEMRNGVAVGDIDGDGIVELIAAGVDRLIVFEHDGSFKWRSDTYRFFGRNDFFAVGVADVDQDSSPEMYYGRTVYDAAGDLQWAGTGGVGGNPTGPSLLSNAVDLDPDSPGLELLAGNTLYSADGAILWQNPDVPDAHTVVGDLDGDGEPEIVLLAGAFVLDRFGNPLTGPDPIGGYAAVIADLDSDEKQEVVLVIRNRVRACTWTRSGFSERWSQPTDDSTTANGAAAYDFDGDGAAEVVYHDEHLWYIFDGRDGTVLYSEPFPSETDLETPVVADIDGDCDAEILISGYTHLPGPNRVVAYDVPGSVPPRAIWNEHRYRVVNVEDDGTIPRVEPPASNWTTGWLKQVPAPGMRAPAADAGPPSTICAGDSVILDGSASVPCDASGFEYRWLDGATEVCPRSPTPTCTVTPSTSTLYTLEVTCLGRCPLEDQATTVVTVMPDGVPDDLGNTLRAIRIGTDVSMSWASTPLAHSYNLYRGTVKGLWPAPALLEGLTGLTALLPDVAPPPRLYYYRVAGAGCSGKEGP